MIEECRQPKSHENFNFVHSHARPFVHSPRPSFTILDVPDEPCPNSNVNSGSRRRSSENTSPNRNLIAWIGVFSLICLLILAFTSHLKWFHHSFVHRREATLATKHCPNRRNSCFVHELTLKNSTRNATAGVPPSAWEAIELSQHTIRAVVLGLQSEDILESLVSALDRGVEVRVVLAEDAQDSQVGRLALAGAEVKVWLEARQHTKFGVYDGRLVVVGPERWMDHPLASPRRELVLLSEDRGLIQDLENYFDDIWIDAGPIWNATSSSHSYETGINRETSQERSTS